MPSDPPLTDEEVCQKFGITVDSPSFRTAKGLAHGRHDRVICVVPECQCPHCCREFSAPLHFLMGKESFWCSGCLRLIYIEHLDLPGDEDFDPEYVCVTFNTDPEPSK